MVKITCQAVFGVVFYFVQGVCGVAGLESNETYAIPQATAAICRASDANMCFQERWVKAGAKSGPVRGAVVRSFDLPREINEIVHCKDVALLSMRGFYDFLAVLGQSNTLSWSPFESGAGGNTLSPSKPTFPHVYYVFDSIVNVVLGILL